MEAKTPPGGQKKDYFDVYYATFHGFDILEKEFRADGHYHGRASRFAGCKEALIRNRPRSRLCTAVSDCFMIGPVRSVALLDDSAVVIHGPVGCGHYAYSAMGFSFQVKKIFCTATDENDVLLGGEKKLKEAIEEVIETYRPGMIGVVTTCSTSIMATDITGICESLEKRTGIPIIPFPGAGFKHRNWNLGAEEAFNIMIDRMERADKKVPNSVNNLSFPMVVQTWRETLELLPYFEELGIKINTNAPCYISFQELIKRFPQAELNIHRCAGTGMQSAEYAEKRLGIPYLQAPPPISLKFTEQFIRALAGFFGQEARAEALIKREKERIKDRLEAVKARLRGKRIAVACCGIKGLALTQLATELGMEPVYLAAYKVDPRYHDCLQDYLSSHAHDPEMCGETSAYEEEAILRRLRPDFFIGGLEARYLADILGIPNLESVTNPNPATVAFEGFIQFGELIADMVEHGFYKNWAGKLWGQTPPYSSEEYLNSSALSMGLPEADHILE